MKTITDFNSFETIISYICRMKRVEYMSMMKNIIGAGLIALSCATVQANELRGSIASEATGGSDWSGFYMGAGVSYVSYEDVDTRFAPTTGAYVGTGGSFVSNGDDLAVSVHVGYNAQFGNVVVGAEADFINMGSTFKVLPPALTPLKIRVNDLMSARLRVGYAFDKFLPYVTGGVAYAATNIPNLDGYGMVGGAGVDYKVTDNLIFGVSYLHYNFKDFGGDPIEVDADVVTARFSAKF